MKRITLGLLLALCAIMLANALFPPPLERLISASRLVKGSDGVALRAFPTAQGRWRLPVALSEVDPHFIDALIRVEDKRFFAHFGVDYIALMRASFQALWRGKIDSGASTLTMQTARLLEPRPRTIGSKLIEMVRAHQIELRLDKQEILEAYLTLAPYGGNLEGIESAAWAWFGKNADSLTDPEIALLLALPQAPESRRPDRRWKAAKTARDAIAEELATFGIWAKLRAKDVVRDPLPRQRHIFPNAAWHASLKVFGDMPDQGNATASINGRLQSTITEHLQRRLAPSNNAVQAGAILVDIPSRCVVAYVGSIGRDRAGGWMDLMARPRSPGSALKPFIYGMAMDRGLVRPDSVLSDFPTSFGGYNPDNFDKGFRGEVRMAEALQHSLNIPAVQILDSFGAENLKASLSFAGVPLVISGQDKAATGLSLALGAVGISGISLAQLYAALGDHGRVKPLRWAGDCNAHSDAIGTEMLGSVTATQILDILKGAPAPSGRSPANLTTNAPQLAYKTGTSYGYRDAWAAGVAGELAAVVWVGRPDGAPNGRETGRSAALPLLFDIVDLAFANPALGQNISQSNRSVHKAQNKAKERAIVTPRNQGPDIVFPPKHAVLYIAPKRTSRFVFAANSDETLDWYVDGQPVKPDPLGQAVWVPQHLGFHIIAAVDSDGQRSQVSVRVKMFATN